MKFFTQLADRGWRQEKGAPSTTTRVSTIRLLRLLQIALPVMLVLSLLSALPALAVDESTLIYENNESSTSAVGSPLTDGDYVVWEGTSVSVHWHCSAVNLARLDEHEPTQLLQVSKTESWMAIDSGYLLVASRGGSCADDSRDTTSEAASGMFLIDLATGESQTLLDDAESVAQVAIDYPYVAWAESETVENERHVTIRAMNLTSDSSPTEIVTETLSSDLRLHLYLEEDTVYWITTALATSNEVGNAARSPIGGSLTYFMSLHDTTDAVLAGDIMVTLTEGRPLLHDLTTGGTLWLADGEANNLATDGRYVFWGIGPYAGDRIIGYDTLTRTRFTVWQIQPDDPERPGSVEDVAVRNGAIVWVHYAYNTWMTAIHGSSIASHLPSASQPDPATTSPDWTYYPETGHYLSHDFRDFWNDNGGLPVFGYPMTEEFDYLSPETGNAYAAQMTERQRFEWHPENIGTPYAVLLGRLGETILQEQGRDWNTFAKADPSTEHYFDATGHAIAPEFYDYWSSHGLDLGHPGSSYEESVALFGYPLSKPMLETNADGDTVLTQYFERAVFEYHPDNPESSQVLLRRLGAELMKSWGW